ncbi:f-box domain contaning protein [Gigaspora margarita]|uniref:F-box domain contaning protein n=1 Tax=Gigaspora margarita TaxID=4874 RepID=A0A8H4A258_GIGMA|nr:f-box domain contaning protein [Gigaspora margarita]
MDQYSKSVALNQISIFTISSLSKSHSPLIALPPEIFLNICKHLPPFDLFSLTRVCRLFYNDLCLGDSVTIKDIWRQSRLVFMPYRQMGPPEGMNEKEYVRFLVEDKCYFCGRKNKSSKIYWERGVRSCFECLKTRTKTQEELIEKKIVPPAVLHLLPCSYTRSIPIFWLDQIMPKNEEFNRLTSQECLVWMDKQRNITEQIEKEMDLRFFEDMAAKKVQKTERKHAIDAKINEFCLEKNENGTSKYLRRYLDQCHSLKNSYKYIRPFTEKSWRLLKRKLAREYSELIEQEKENVSSQRPVTLEKKVYWID